MSNSFANIAQEGKLTIGLVFPLEAYEGSVPKMENQEQLAQLAEEVGFKALWFRDVPFHDPTFGDAGQMFDPWVYMTHIMNHTKEITLATGSIILPLRHPVHTLKSINSLQVLSNGRIVVGVASGDRPIEYPAFNQNLNDKSELFRDSFNYLKSLNNDFPNYQSENFGVVNGNIDVLPKSPFQTPYLVTGHSGQNLSWIAKNADGWLYYPRNLDYLKMSMNNWQLALEENECSWKPYMQSLYIDLFEDKTAAPSPIHLGFRTNAEYLRSYLKNIRSIGVNHVMLNLKFNKLPIKQTMELIGKEILSQLN